MTSHLHKPPNPKKGNRRSAFPDTPDILESHVNTRAELRKETQIEAGATENPEHVTTKWGSSRERRRGPASEHEQHHASAKLKRKSTKLFVTKNNSQRTSEPCGRGV